MEINLRKFSCDLDWEQVPNWECMFVLRKQGLSLSIYVDDINCWKRAEYGSHVEEIVKNCGSWRTHIFS